MDEELKAKGSSRPENCSSNPVDGLSDIRSVQGVPYFFPRYFEDQGINAGMMARHVVISDRHGALSKLNIDMLDMVFMISVLSQMLHDDVKAVKAMTEYKLVGRPKTKSGLEEQLAISLSSLSQVQSLFAEIDVWTPPDYDEQDED